MQVNVNAPSARVYVNEEDKGTVSPGNPLNMENFPTGTASVRVEAEGYESLQRTVNIQRNQWTQEVFELKKVQVTSLPPPVYSKVEPVTNNPSQFLEMEVVRASHILVMVDKSATKDAKETARKKIDELLQRAKKGEDFANLARANSDDRGSGQRGGDIGFFSKGMMVPNFEKAAFALKKGEIRNVVETEFGYHIIKLTDRKS